MVIYLPRVKIHPNEEDHDLHLYFLCILRERKYNDSRGAKPVGVIYARHTNPSSHNSRPCTSADTQPRWQQR